MKVAIVEDEKLATERLKMILKEYDPSVEVVASLESIDDIWADIKQALEASATS